MIRPAVKGGGRMMPPGRCPHSGTPPTPPFPPWAEVAFWSPPPPRQGDARGRADARISADACLSWQKVQGREANRRRHRLTEPTTKALCQPPPPPPRWHHDFGGWRLAFCLPGLCRTPVQVKDRSLSCWCGDGSADVWVLFSLAGNCSGPSLVVGSPSGGKGGVRVEG